MRSLQALLTLTLALTLPGCIFLSEDAPSSPTPTPDAPPDLIDAPDDAPVDVPDDASDAPDDSGPELPCTLESEEALYCKSEEAQCGELTVLDSCGAPVTIRCGECVSGTCTDNRCDTCVPEDDATLCAINGSCGALSVVDRCGDRRELSCAQLGCQGEGTSCDPVTETCTCDGERACPTGRTCGTFVNACGEELTCGTCGDGERCDRDSGTCFCPIPRCPDTAECGSVTNSCGKTRTCGDACPGLGESCDPAQLQCVCDNSLTDAQLCGLEQRECGVVDVALCGATRRIDCGGCGIGLARCSSQGQCRIGG